MTLMRPSAGRGLVVAFALALATAGAKLILPDTPAMAQESEQQRLKSLKQELAGAEKRRAALTDEEKRLAGELEKLSRRLVATAEQVHRQEDALTRVELEIGELDQEQTRLAAALDTRRAQLAGTLAALERLSQQPPQLLLLRPVSATQTARSAMLLNAVMPELQAQAAAMRSEIDTLTTVRRQLADTQAQHRVELAVLETARAELDDLRQQRAARRAEVAGLAEAEAKRIADLVKESRTLEELLAKLDAERQRLASAPSPRPRPDRRRAAAGPVQPFSSARGTLSPPASGEILTAFGERTEEGSSKGLSILTREQATVVAPYDGTVVFADRFRSYGELLIIEHGEGYHSVLAGMEQLDGSVGQWVLAGEPLGAMGRADQIRRRSGNPEGKPVLYVEIQRDGRPINPLPWLSAKLERVRP